MCYGSMDIIGLFNKVKPPYNVNGASQQLGLEALQNTTLVNDWITATVAQRELLVQQISTLPFVEKVYPSDANFFLMKVKDAGKLYSYLSDHEIVVRNRSKDPGCENCLRITIGTPEENEQLINLLNNYGQ